MPLRVLSLFSGIGGFDLACGWAGMEIVGQVEIDPFCNKVLAKHWPNVKRMEDIKNVKGKEFGQIDLICGGPPCQPASVAGKQRGKADDRWLWPEAIRLLSTIQPTWAVFENPTGLLSLERSVVFRLLLSEMENEGYEVWSVIIPACSVKAPHQRDRIWIIGYSEHNRCNRKAIPIQLRESQQKSAMPSGTNCNTASKWWNEPWPEVAQRLCKLDDGVPTRLVGYLGITKEHLKRRNGHQAQKIKAFGNAVVPQVAYQIMRAIVIADHKTKRNPQ